MAHRNRIHKSGLAPLTPPDQIARNINRSHAKRRNLPPARSTSERVDPPAGGSAGGTGGAAPRPKKRAVSEKKTIPSGGRREKTADTKSGVFTEKAPIVGTMSPAKTADKKSVANKPGKPVADRKPKKPSVTSANNGKRSGAQKDDTVRSTNTSGRRSKATTAGAAPTVAGSADQATKKNSTKKNRGGKHRGGAHRKKSRAGFRPLGGGEKKEVTPESNKGEKIKPSKVKNPRKNTTIIDTQYDPKHYDEKFSSNDIVEAQEKAGLTDYDVKKIHNKVSDNAISQQVRSNGKAVQPLPKIVVIQPRKKKIFAFITSVWFVVLIIAATVVSGYGYTVWKDSELSKKNDEAYAMGVESAKTKPDVSSVMKLGTGELKSLISGAQGVQLPKNPSFSNYSLQGWTIPGGNSREGKAEVSFCYTGTGIRGSLQGSAFFFTPDAQSVKPEWTVDTVALTQVPCGTKQEG